MTFDALKHLGWSPAWEAARAATLARAEAKAEARVAAATGQAGGGATAQPYRIARLHKSRADGLGAEGAASLAFAPTIRAADVAVGDWVLASAGHITHVLLPRQSLLLRRAPGAGGRAGLQGIAANVDVMLIVTACGAEFSPARLERYLVLAHASAITPLVVLTKIDVTAPEPFAAQARACARGAHVLALNAKTEAAQVLAHIGAGQTAVLMGSSGVGKSTLANGMIGAQVMATGAVRAADDRGRHTTTARHLLALPQGGWLIDTPGLREVQLADMARGIDLTFDDILALAPACRFRNCQHESEPGCAVQSAVAQGQIEAARLARWRKLHHEGQASQAALQAAETRAAGRNTRKSAAKHRPASS